MKLKNIYSRSHGFILRSAEVKQLSGEDKTLSPGKICKNVMESVVKYE